MKLFRWDYVHLSLIKSVSEWSFLKISSKHCLSQTVKARGPEILTQCSPPPVFHVIHIMSYMPHVTYHMSWVMCHMSGVRCHMSGVTCQVSHVTCNSPTVIARKLTFWEKDHLLSPVMCHVSHVMCNVSSVTCHRSFFSFFSFYKVVKPFGGGSVFTGATQSSF